MLLLAHENVPPVGLFYRNTLTPLGSILWGEDSVNPQVDLSVSVHTITLTVTDNDGLTDTDEVVITINPPAPSGVLDDFNRSDGGVFCRVLVENGSFRGDPGQMGDLRLIELGIVQAVDVFGLMAGGQAIVPFNQPVYVCLRGTGVLYYADASNAPRIYSQIASVVQDGFTCASIPNAGTLVLVNGGA